MRNEDVRQEYSKAKQEALQAKQERIKAQQVTQTAIAQARAAEERKPRITVVETVYHQAPGQQPTSVECRHTKSLDSDEQPYTRRVKVGQEWQALDCGWLEEASLLVLSNAKEQFAVNPTDEQRQEAEARVVEVGIAAEDDDTRITPLFLIAPGDTFRGQPLGVKAIKLRCRKGEATVTINLFPK